jgi:hypothetical protein
MQRLSIVAIAALTLFASNMGAPALAQNDAVAQANTAQAAPPAGPSTAPTAPPAPSSTNSAAPAACGAACPPAPQPFVFVVVGAVVLLVALLSIRTALARSPSWSLGDALSEEADLTNDQGVAVTVMRASTSRVIALAGLVVMLCLYLGFGVFILYDFGIGRGLPSGMGDIEKFMLAGLSLFAPYAVNQARAAMDGLTSAASPSPAPAANPAAGAAAAPSEPVQGGC